MNLAAISSGAARALVLSVLVSGCAAAAAGAPQSGRGTPPTGAPPTAAAASPIDPAVIAASTGGTPETSGDTVKVSFPRNDVTVDIEGLAKVPPFMGLTSWAAFTPGWKPGAFAMAAGDLVLFEDEVNPAMSAALGAGLEVTALHNHFFFDRPRVFFMHIGGEGPADQLGRGVKAALDAQRAVRRASATPKMGFDETSLPATSHVDAARLDAIFGVKGQSKDGMYKAVMGRTASAACGCTVGKAMGVNTWAAFAGTDASAVVDGDFAVTEAELQPVLKALRAAGIYVVAIHHHMTGESPRILFVHYWGKGAAAELASAVRRALNLTAWDGKRDGPTT